MVRREIPAVEILWGDTEQLFKTLNEAPDLAVAIVAVAYLDATLGNLLRSAFGDPEATNRLLDIGGPLESFGARCQAARALNLISDVVLDDLKKIGKIRNKFAHHHLQLDFADEELGRWCDSMSLNHDPINVETGQSMKVPHMSEAHRIRARFLMITLHLSHLFLREAAKRGQ